MISSEFAERFAEEWIAAWNAHDLPRVLSHYRDDFEMSSPRIVEVAGEPSGILRGKASVGAYWAKALRLVSDLRFEKLGVFVGVSTLAIHYRNQAGRLAVETFEFADTGHAIRAASHYA
jgi:ketosteroid isomerase-like protein